MSRLDRGLLLAIFALIGIGLVQVYSSSFIFAIESRGDGLFFFKRQAMFVLLAVPVLLGAALAPWALIEKSGFVLWSLAGLAVAATFVPGMGVQAGGAARWLSLPGGFVFEPCELLKVALPVLFATCIAKRRQFLGSFETPFWFAVFAIPTVLVLKQKDFGSFFICVSVLIFLLFSFGLRWRFIGVGLALILPAFYFLIVNVPYRKERIMAFLDPWADPEGKGFQVIQSMLSFQSGGLFGVGLGQGQGKLFFLPEAHTDFTLAVLAEEMGFLGVVAVIAIYGFIVMRGLQIASRFDDEAGDPSGAVASDRFSKALALGLALTFGLQVFINAGVALGLLPTKGLTLPFLSYGGSSLLTNCLLCGLLLNVERRQRFVQGAGGSGRVSAMCSTQSRRDHSRSAPGVRDFS